MTQGRNAFVLLVLMLSVLSVQAQTKNVNINNFRFSAAFRELPSKPQEPLFFTYTTLVNATKSTEQRTSTDEIHRAMYIQGQQLVDNPEEASVFLVANLGDLIILSTNVTERREEKKDKDGKVVDVSFYYRSVIEYTFTSTYSVFKGDNKILGDVMVNSGLEKKISRSDEFRSRREAVDFWNNNRDVIISQLVRGLSLETAQAVSSRASRLYGFPVVKENDLLMITNEKKHAENELFREMCEKLKSELEQMTPNVGPDEEQLADAIAYFESIPDKYTNPKSKADVKLRFAAYYNLAKIYEYLDRPDDMRKYAACIIQNEHNKKDGEKIKKKADELTEMLNRTEFKTRHFNPEEYF